MIKLNRTSKPKELTTKFKSHLTNEYKLTGKSVWNKKFIKKSLLAFSHNKCCYCETDITKESKYLEVEHFHPKKIYKDEVLEWDNLLPSCKRCNSIKNDHDTVLEPIIDPSKINPKNHLKYFNYRIKGSDQLGKLTISVLNLNDADRLVKKRFEIGNAIHSKLEQFNEGIDEYITGVSPSTIKKNRIISGIKELMKEGLPNAIYSATSANIILNDPEYNILKEKIIDCNLWDDELKEIEEQIKIIAL